MRARDRRSGEARLSPARGFSLMELMVVLAVFAAVTGIIFACFSLTQERLSGATSTAVNGVNLAMVRAQMLADIHSAREVAADGSQLVLTDSEGKKTTWSAGHAGLVRMHKDQQRLYPVPRCRLATVIEGKQSSTLLVEVRISSGRTDDVLIVAAATRLQRANP